MPGTPENVIELHSVACTLGQRKILSAVSVAFQKNSITAVLGKSGSGKSTLLQLINGMLQPSAGVVKFQGLEFDYHQRDKIRLQMGYVVQSVGLFPHMTIMQNISLLGRITNLSAETTHERVDYLMQLVGLSPADKAKYPYELSGGEQQRVGLCRAMLLQPEVLLMDEPFASLDYVTKFSIYKHLKVIQQKEPKTIVMVTHDWDEAITLADRFVWIDNGTLKAGGDRDELIALKASYLAEHE